MTILTADTPWPTVWALNPGSGFREPKPKALLEMVMTAVEQILHDTGQKPTLLMVPMARRTEFMKMFNEAIGMPDRNPAHGCSQFVGLQVLWCAEGAMRVE